MKTAEEWAMERWAPGEPVHETWEAFVAVIRAAQIEALEAAAGQVRGYDSAATTVAAIRALVKP